VEVQNGSDLYLTLDVNIQGIVEKHLEKGVVDNKRSCGVSYTYEAKNGRNTCNGDLSKL